MHIKQVIIDGFKSYANRTVISGWDPMFNAITGLNGSGKSNILDAICFVLGIEKLAQVRAKNLQELVYKQGQSRVTKASVSIIFDNSDVKSSPMGYEDCKEITVTRQVVIGGKNKYLVNGHTAQLGRVQNLFHSVQLNVNNPHFLIMQGRITKVCNMKPPEVLSMIEEAAGTRMYESKKAAAIKTIAKKQTKVDEINKLLAEEITPNLEKIKLERANFLQWSANNTEVERMTRFCIAASFVEAKALLEESKGEVGEMEAKKEALITAIEDAQRELEEISETQQQLTQEKEEQLQSLFDDLKKQLQACSTSFVKHTSIWKNQETEVKSQQKVVAGFEKSIKEIQDNIAAKTQEQQQMQTNAQAAENKHQELEQEVASLQGQLLGISVSSDKQDAQGSLTAQLMEAQRQLTEAESNANQMAIKARHIQQTLSEKSKELKANAKQFAKVEADLENKKKELAVVETKLQASRFDPEAKKQCETQLAKLEALMIPLREQVEQLAAKLARVEFDYTAPRGFDQKQVKGLVAKLLEVKDSKNAVALEVAAGGKLYNVVVDTEKTGKTLIEQGRLKRRVTIIPLNKISSKVTEWTIVGRAKELVGDDNVSLALSLVGYDEEVSAAMKHVFGTTLVCSDSKTAEIVTFDKGIRTRSVTLQGDVFDPAGTLTGGSQPSGGSILAQLQHLTELRTRLASQEAARTACVTQLEALRRAENGTVDLQASRELLSHEIALMQTRMGQSSYSQMKDECGRLEAELKATAEAEAVASEMKQKQTIRCQELEASIRDFDQESKRQAQNVAAKMQSAKKRLGISTAAIKQKRQCIEQVKLEIEGLCEDLAATQTQMQEAVAELAKAIKLAQGYESKVSAEKELYDVANEALERENKKLSACDTKIRELEKARVKANKLVSDTQLELQKINHRITRMHADSQSAGKRVESLIKTHSWLNAEKHLFGNANTDYDFKAMPPKQAQKKLAQLQKEQEDLGKKINKKVMGMYEKAEREYQDLLKKRDIIEKDKSKINEVISELDIKKNQALETTHRKVTRDFNSIFSTLLPGTQARLEPPEGQSVLDGLEVKVAFGSVWKESLSELSGGQRSLLALSLILALLLFKPAPMYILDEVDAALDLSHTQNIGKMLKAHFKQSQFIVVSLKEGMFNNANVIYRTKFVDGVSTVVRTANASGPLTARGGEKVKPSHKRLKVVAEPADDAEIEDDAALA
jgi:structural maintenance of chromosome 2